MSKKNTLVFGFKSFDTTILEEENLFELHPLYKSSLPWLMFCMEYKWYVVSMVPRTLPFHPFPPIYVGSNIDQAQRC